MISTVTHTLPVMESFYTLQGEGFHQGRAAYFIRLGGCDVGCTWCDVKESWDASAHPQLRIEEIVGKAMRACPAKGGDTGYEIRDAGYGMRDAGLEMQDTECGIEDENQQPATSNRQPTTSNQQPVTSNRLAVITGGEPLLHNLDELTRQLHAAGFETNIETSGSSPLSGEWDWICLSPKKFKAPLPELVPLANELKVVVFNKHDFEWAEKYAVQVSSSCKLYLQPEWDKASIVTPLIIEYIKQNPKWELSLQIHKYINVP